MILKVTLADQLLELNVPDELIRQAQDFFAKMDADMDQGWQVNREWFDQPDQMLRGQIVADKLLTALENEDHNLGRLMAGYLCDRFPDIDNLELSEEGEIRDHVLNMNDGTALSGSNAPGLSFSHEGVPVGLGEGEAMMQTSKDVSDVFKMGKQYRFSIYNHATGAWDESPAFGNQEDAESARQDAYRQRFEALIRASQIH